MADYPDWVKKFRRKGTAIKKVGNSYYLYQHTSKRVPGKKYPQAVDKFIGVITPDGVVEKNKKKVSLEDIEVYKYGFSYTLYSICPEKWKKSLKDEWIAVLKSIISYYSPNSYLLLEVNDECSKSVSLYERKLFDFLNISLEELLSLSTIYLLRFKDRDVISKINDDQNEILDRLNVKIEGVSG